jgi:hypothetical protein
MSSGRPGLSQALLKRLQNVKPTVVGGTKTKPPAGRAGAPPLKTASKLALPEWQS